MGYKLLGFVVWQGGKWWVRRKLSSGPAKIAVAGLGAAAVAAVAAGVIAAGRQGSPD